MAIYTWTVQHTISITDQDYKEMEKIAEVIKDEYTDPWGTEAEEALPEVFEVWSCDHMSDSDFFAMPNDVYEEILHELKKRLRE